MIDAETAIRLAQTEEGQQLSPENGAVEITEKLIALDRQKFYAETFRDEVF